MMGRSNFKNLEIALKEGYKILMYSDVVPGCGSPLRIANLSKDGKNYTFYGDMIGFALDAADVAYGSGNLTSQRHPGQMACGHHGPQNTLDEWITNGNFALVRNRHDLQFSPIELGLYLSEKDSTSSFSGESAIVTRGATFEACYNIIRPISFQSLPRLSSCARAR